MHFGGWILFLVLFLEMGVQMGRDSLLSDASGMGVMRGSTLSGCA